mmetsp:Transcript_84484/g.235302  ORF Transcript_84484/g.235302 Transcript_84484/m.235302 type:complete len:248 (-) Transcript_84484:147-890(-)
MLAELAHRVHLAGRQYVVVTGLLLKHAPHALHIVTRVAPVALRVHVAQVQAVLQPALDAGHGARDLAGHESGSAPRRLVVEEDAVDAEHVVRLAVVLDNPKGVQLGHAVGRARVEGRRLGLRDLLHLAVELRGGGLVEAARLLEARRADGVEQAQRAQAVHVARVLGHVEGYLDVALRRQVVHLGRLHARHDAAEVAGVREITVVQEQLDARRMPVFVQMLDAARVEAGRAADNAVHLVALLKQQLC